MKIKQSHRISRCRNKEDCPEVVKQCVSTEGVEADYIRTVDTTVDIVGRTVEDLKDESEPYHRVVMETIEKVVANLGASDINARLEELLIDVIIS
ncbi:hypothetical protein SUGI_0200400 [Cryptomeria japonica]|nr:hypothetical protein SUGI_0200400 [Cryptomeria japonica]